MGSARSLSAAHETPHATACLHALFLLRTRRHGHAPTELQPRLRAVHPLFWVCVAAAINLADLLRRDGMRSAQQCIPATVAEPELAACYRSHDLTSRERVLRQSAATREQAQYWQTHIGWVCLVSLDGRRDVRMGVMPRRVGVYGPSSRCTIRMRGMSMPFQALALACPLCLEVPSYRCCCSIEHSVYQRHGKRPKATPCPITLK